MKRLAFTTLAMALAATSGVALAYQDGYGRGDSNGYRSDGSYDYRDVRYDSARFAPSPPRGDVAQVIRVEPIYGHYGPYHRQECWNEQANRYDGGYYRDDDGRLYRGDGRGNTSGAVIGAIVGGALGNQVGKGDGRTAATVAGVVIGGVIGNNTGRNAGYDQYRDSDGIIRRCRTVEDYGNRRSISAYNVTYRYAGNTYHAVTYDRPGRTMRVMVDVRPRDGSIAYNR